MFSGMTAREQSQLDRSAGQARLTPGSLRRGVFAVALLVGGYAALMAVSEGFNREAVSDVGLVVLPLVTFACCWAAAQRERGRARSAWVLMGISALSWALGETIWTIYELGLGREVPFPSLADVGYLAAVPLAGAAFLAFPEARTTTMRLRTALDGIITAASLLCVSWVTVIGPLYEAGSESWLEMVIGLSYPLGDVALVSIVLIVAARADRGYRGSHLLLGAGIVAFAVADSGFAYLTLRDAYVSGNPIDVGWAIGYGLMALAAYTYAGSRPSSEGRSAGGGVRLLLPYFAVGVAVIAIAVKQIGEGRLETFVVWTSITIFVLLLVRQLLTLLDNISLTQDLEAKVKERTVQLEDALSELSESSRLQDEFVANTSHELRTPLTVILGSLHVLARPEMAVNDDQRSLLEGALRQAKNMQKRVEDLLAASAIRMGDDAEPEAFDVLAAIKEVTEKESLSDKNLVLEVPSDLSAFGDVQKFRTILAHLLSNAVKFAPPKTTVRVGAASSGAWVDVVVSDEGPGIPEDLREKAFRRFVQLDGGSTRKVGGMGLGLYLSGRLAEAMGGRLTLDDSEGGASFRLRIPAASGLRASAGLGT